MRRDAANPSPPNANAEGQSKRRRSFARLVVVALASIALLVPAVNEASAQFGINIGGFGIGGGGDGGYGSGNGRGYGRGGNYGRGSAGRTPGGRGTYPNRGYPGRGTAGSYPGRGTGGGYPGRYPRGPRGPGGVILGIPAMIPPDMGPRGPVVTDDDDDPPPRRRIHRAEKPERTEKSQRADKKSTKAPRKQEARQRRQPPASRRVTGVPPRGEDRFVPDQVICVLRANLTDRQIDRFVRDNRLARTDGGAQRIELLNARVFRYRITDGRPVPTVIATLERDNRVISAQPNYVYSLAQAQESVAAQAPALNTIAKSAADAAAAVLSAVPAAKPTEPAAASDPSSATPSAASNEAAPASPAASDATAAAAGEQAAPPAADAPAPEPAATTASSTPVDSGSDGSAHPVAPSTADTASAAAVPAVAPAAPNAAPPVTEASAPVDTSARPHADSLAPRLPADPMQYTIAKMHLTQAHNLARGEQVLVAVIDSKIDATHPELAGTIVEDINVLNDKDAPPHAHGTAMAGAIVAQSKIMGVAPEARIVAIRAFSQTATGAATGTSYDLARAIDRAVEAHARVINLSFAGPSDPMLEKALSAAHEAGAILVAAAGNAGPKSAPLYPAADASVIAVTATDAQDNVYADANRGKYIAVAAPGVDVLVPAPERSYEMTTGTSVAAAHVSGIVALLLGRHPELAPDDVRAIIAKSASRPASGAAEDYGAGIADAYKAIVTLDPKASAPPPSTSARR